MTSKKGGPRPGAGRPPGTTKPPTGKAVTIRLPFSQIDWLNAQPESQSKTLAALIREAMSK